MATDHYDRIVAIMRENGCWKIDGGKGSHEMAQPDQQSNSDRTALEESSHGE